MQFNLCLRNRREKRVTSREFNKTRPSTLIHHAKKQGGKTKVLHKFIPFSANPEMGDLFLRKVEKEEDRNYYKSHL
jgi:hypothetical protein